MVASESGDQLWTLTTRRQGRNWLLDVTDMQGNSWAGEGPDLFEALRALRRALDPLGIQLGVNGARRNAWASGMQRDMGEGRVVYLLSEGQSGRPPQVNTLGSAPMAEVGTVAEQEERHARWLNSRPPANLPARDSAEANGTLKSTAMEVSGPRQMRTWARRSPMYKNTVGLLALGHNQGRPSGQLCKCAGR